MLPTFYQTHLQNQLTQAQFILLTILLNLIQSEKQVRLERLVRVFPYPITTESLARQITKISRCTSINDRTTLASIDRLLVNNLLPYRTKVIDCARPQSVGVYQSVHARIDLAEEGYPIILVFITQIRKQ
jgi:hypothetical protein